jgi:hypothetical protein
MEERVKKEDGLKQRTGSRHNPTDDASQVIDLADLGIPRLTGNRNPGASPAQTNTRAESPGDDSQPAGDKVFAQGAPDGGVPADGGSPADAGATPSASISVNAPAMTDTESQKLVTFNATWSGGAKEDYIIVQWLKGSVKKPDGTPFTVQMYGKDVDFNFADFQIDSMDEDPAYWSDGGVRWRYTVDAPNKFSATDKPGKATWEKGSKAHVDFKVAVYKSADVPNKTTGTIAATPLSTFAPWTYYMEALGGGKFSH